MNKILTLCLLFSLTILSCKKDVIELPPSTVGEPVFSTDASLDGTNLNLVAGDDDYYMYTEWTKDANDVHTFIGRFAEEDCNTACKESLQFEIRDITPTTSTPNINYGLTTGSLSFTDVTAVAEDLVQVQLSLNTDVVDPKKIRWRFTEIGGGTITKEDQTDLVVNFKKKADYDARSQVTAENGLISSLSRGIKFEKNFDCAGDYTVTALANGDLELTAIPEASSAASFYIWSYDLASPIGIDPSYIITPQANSLDTVCSLVINYDDTCFSDISRNFLVDDSGNAIYTNTSYDYEVVQEIPDGTLLQLASFAVQYTDPDGKVYRSDLLSQSSDNTFEIVAVEDYNNNENGEQTKKLTINYDCRLYAADGAEKDIKAENSVIAVAYPN